MARKQTARELPSPFYYGFKRDSQDSEKGDFLTFNGLSGRRALVIWDNMERAVEGLQVMLPEGVEAELSGISTLRQMKRLRRVLRDAPEPVKYILRNPPREGPPVASQFMRFDALLRLAREVAM